MMDMLTVRMAERVVGMNTENTEINEGMTEHLKSVDQLGWVRKMNNIRSRGSSVA